MHVEILLFVLLVAVAVVVARLKDLFAATMLLGMFSLLSAGLFTLMDAVDVAFTEASVGAGISTVLILGTLALTDSHERQQPTRILPFVVVLLTGAALVYGTLDMPMYGDAAAPIHNHVADDYILEEAGRFHIPNIVTAILASWRGYDTYGETTVIFTAGVGVMALLGGGVLRRRREEGEGDAAEQGGEA